MPDNIYTKDQQVKIRNAFIEVLLASLSVTDYKLPTKPDLDSQLEELVYPLGDSPRSVKAFLRQDGHCRKYYRDYEGLSPLPDTVENLINQYIFSIDQFDMGKNETIEGTPLDKLRKVKGLPNPMSPKEIESLYEETDHFAEDVSTRGHQKVWQAIADSIEGSYEVEKLSGWYGNKVPPFKLAWQYNKPYFFSLLLRYGSLIIITILVLLWITSWLFATF